MMAYQNIYGLFRAQTEKYGDRPVFYVRESGGWVSISWKEFEESVHDVACALRESGLTPGACVAILAGNIPEWSISDVGTIAAGGVGVGVYPSSSAEQCEYIIGHSDAEFVITDTLAQFEKVKLVVDSCPKVKEILCIENGSFSQFLKLGRSVRERHLPSIELSARSADSGSIAVMVYTSGTTGRPKGAMLSHRYILNSLESLRRSVPIFETDVSLSYLPGCHVAERISGIYNRLFNGTPAYFIDDLSRLYERMIEIRPTVFASLPRFFEKIHAQVVSEFGEAAEAQSVRDAFGSRIRLLTSGGAPLPVEIAHFFAERGLPVLQAYGLTENICVAFNTADHFKFGTVGRPMPMCQVKIASDGEILVNSPMMFSGYYKDPVSTSEMLDADGWLKTGDLGALDEDGYLTITGRKKEIIVLSTGKNVSPALIENLVKESHLVSHCFVFGDGHSYCVALITRNEAEAAMTENVDEKIKEAIDNANSRVSSPEQIKKYVILDRDLSPDEVTPTMKVKRNVVANNYQDILERLYA